MSLSDGHLHLHISVAGAAVVVADDGVLARRVGSDRDISRLAWNDVGIDLERPEEEPVLSILAAKAENYRLALLQSDLARGEVEFLCLDLDHARPSVRVC